MTPTEVDARERTVVVSPEALGKLFPPSAAARPSLASRLAFSCKLRSRLALARLRFAMDALRPLHCRAVQCRLRAKLTWIQLRHRRALLAKRRRSTDKPSP